MMRESTRRWVRIGAWLVATTLIVLLFRTVDSSRVVRVVSQTNPAWLVLAIACSLIVQPLGAMQWRSLLPKGVEVSRGRMIRLFSLTSVANNTTPSIIGHATGALLLAAEPGVGKTAAISVLALDQLAVGLAKIGILIAATTMLSLPSWMLEAMSGLAIVVGVLLVTTLLVSRTTRFLEPLREPRRFLAALICAIAIKLCEAGAILAVQASFGLTLSVRSLLVVLGASALGSVIPIAPANIGTYEAAAYGAYRFLGMTPEAALGIAVVQHVCQLLAAVVPGYVILSLPRFNVRTSPLRV